MNIDLYGLTEKKRFRKGLILKAIIAGILILLILLFGCGEDKITNEKTAPVDYFPNRVGTYWKYEAYDSVRQTYDTVTVSIVDTLILPEMSYPSAVWTFSPKNQWLGIPHDTLFVTEIANPQNGDTKDTAEVYWWREGFEPWLRAIYIVPFSIGEYWTSVDVALMFDSTHVQDTASISVPAGDFTGVYRVVHIYSCGDECGATYKYWFKHGIGIVKSSRVEWDIFDFPDGPQLNAVWELIDYHIEK